MNSKIQIQKAELSDLPQIFDVFQNAIRETAKEYYTPMQVDAWANSIYSRKNMWEFRIKNEEFVIAKKEDEIIGFAALKGLDYFDLLFVSPQYSRLGIASEMYDRLEQIVPANTLLKTHASDISKPFFLKKGYSKIEENKIDILGVMFINHLMQKQL